MREFIQIVEGATLPGIKAEAAKAGVELRLIDASRTVKIKWIGNKSGVPGAAKVIMRRLCEFADEHNVRLTLDVLDGAEDLIAYYEQFGFKVDPSTREDAEPLMYRDAQLSEDALGALYSKNGYDAELHDRKQEWLPKFQEWIAKEADPKEAARFAYWLGSDEPHDFWHQPEAEKRAAAQQVKTVTTIPASLWIAFMNDARLINRPRPHEDGYNWGLSPLSPEPLPAETWLIHFSHDALGVFYHGFQKGTPSAEPEDLYATFGEGDHKMKPGYNFAFLASSFEQMSYTDDDFYGESVIMFRARGVHTYHSGDGDEEVIFYGPEVDIRKAYLLMNTEHGFTIQNHASKEVLHRAATLADAVDWVVANAG